MTLSGSPNTHSHTLEDVPVENNAISGRSNTALAQPRDPPIRRRSCTTRHCHCSCHMTENRLGRYWGLEYTPLAIMFGKCDNQQCDVKGIRWKFRFSFNNLGVPLALLMDFEFILGMGKYSLRPALSVQRVVAYTSPGFEILWRCRNGLLSFHDAQTQFRELNRSSSPLRQHINPGGDNYVRVNFLIKEFE